jgi:hypothetical protein
VDKDRFCQRRVDAGDQASSAEPRSVGKEGVGQTVQSRWEMRREGEDGWDADGKSSSLPEAVREEDGERDAASSRWLKIGGRTLDLELQGRGRELWGWQ